jgi:ABC-type nitrate/sulfonate/bicarbonate transport system ATPase subunit
MSARLELKNLTKTFAGARKGTEMTVLEDVSFVVEPGAFVTLLGTSGCGKSTLLRILAGLETGAQGQALCDGAPITGTDPKRNLMFQEHTLFPWMTVRGNIAFALKGAGLYQRERGNIDRWIELAGLTEFIKSYPHQLSGGMRQRAALVRALAVSPEALLLDEPLGALDNFTRMRLQEELVRLWNEQGNTMLLVTHDVDEAVYLSQRVVVMSPRPGRVREIMEIPLSYPRNRAGSDFAEYRAKILKRLDYARDPQEDYAI